MSAIDIEKMQNDMRNRQFELYANDFFNRWQPDEPGKAKQFSAELFALVRHIYIDANGPANDLIKKIMELLPLTDRAANYAFK